MWTSATTSWSLCLTEDSSNRRSLWSWGLPTTRFSRLVGSWFLVVCLSVREPVKLRLTKSKMFAMLRKLQRTNVWHYLVSALSWSIKALKINHEPKGVKWNLWRPEDDHHSLPEEELHRGTWRECLHRPCQSGGTRPWPGRAQDTIQDQTWSTKTFFQNRIRTVDQGTFSGLQHLRVLYLDDNDLAEVVMPEKRFLSNF